jgi:hypothetical protein
LKRVDSATPENSSTSGRLSLSSCAFCSSVRGLPLP